MATKQEKIKNCFQKMDYNRSENAEKVNYDEVIQWINNNKTLKLENAAEVNNTIVIQSAITKENFQFAFEKYGREIKDHKTSLKDFQQILKQNYSLICQMLEFFNGIPVKYSESVLIPAIEKLFTNAEECSKRQYFIDCSSYYTNLWKAIKDILYCISNSFDFVCFNAAMKNDLPVISLLRQISSNFGLLVRICWKDFEINSQFPVECFNQIPIIVFNESDLHSAATIAIECAFTKPPIVGKVDTIFVEESALDSFMEKIKSKLNVIKEIQCVFDKESLEIVEREAKSLGLEIYQVNVDLKSKATVIVGGKPFSNMEILKKQLYNAAVLYIIPFRTKEDVLALLKKTPSSYGASIWSEDVSTVNEMSEKVPMKHIWVNCCGLVDYKCEQSQIAEIDLPQVQINWNNTTKPEKLKLVNEFFNTNSSIEFLPELKRQFKIYFQDSTNRSSYKEDNYLITNVMGPIGAIQFVLINNMECKEILVVLIALMKGNIVGLHVYSKKIEEYKSLFKVFVDKGIVEIPIGNRPSISIYTAEFKSETYELIREFQMISKQIWMPI